MNRLKQDDHRIIIPADKGDKSIVMDYKEKDDFENTEEDASAILEMSTYLDKLEERIEGHIKVDIDPAIAHEKVLNTALTKMWKVGRNQELKQNQQTQLILSRDSLKEFMTQGAISPRLKGQLKDHKDEKPLREVSDASKSPGHKLAKVLNKLFAPYTCQTKTAVRGGKELIQYIKEGRFNNNFLASCDAVALYPSVMVEEGLQLLQDKIHQDELLQNKTDLTKNEIFQLAGLCTENPYFECEFGFFKQKGGTPMGGPLSRCLSDLVVENKIEAVIAAHPIWGPRWDWVRLIDDTLSAWESKEVFVEFFEFLNTIHAGIKWTNEMEEDNKLAIFDIQICRTNTGYETTVFRKKSASDRYIHYTSSQVWKEKASAIRTLKQRAIDYCSNQVFLANELDYLLTVFIQNGYPEKTVWRILYQESKPKGTKEEIDFSKSMYVPYHPRTKRLYRMIKEDFGFSIIYKKTQTLGDILQKKGRTIEKQYRKNTVYSIPCKDCPKKYVGQTTGTIKKRCSEHRNWCRKKHKKKILKTSKKNDGIAFHFHETGHIIDFDNTAIIAEEKAYWKRLIIEGMEIKKLSLTERANLQMGYEIDPIWDAIMENIQKT